MYNYHFSRIHLSTMIWTTLQVTIAVYDYRRLGDVGFIKFLFGKVPLLPSTARERLLPLLPSTNSNRPVCMLRRYNLETTSVNECLRCLRCSCLHHVQIVTHFLVANSWDTRNPGAPHHFLHASAHFSFASVSQSSYRNRFRYRCCGTPFLSTTVASAS